MLATGRRNIARATLALAAAGAALAGRSAPAAAQTVDEMISKGKLSGRHRHHHAALRLARRRAWSRPASTSISPG